MAAASDSQESRRATTIEAVTTDTPQASANRAWLLSAVRGAGALIVGVAVVFVQDHSPLVGLTTAVAIFAVTTIALLALLSRAGAARMHVATVAGIHAAAAVAAAILLLTAPEATAMLWLLIAWAIAAGVADFLTAKRAAKLELAWARDWRFVSYLTLAFAALLLASPLLGMSDAISVTGLLGAYAAIIGVFLLIGAASIALGPKATATSSEAHP